MLVLTRGIGQVILIGDDVQLTIIDLNTERVRIGINAPKEVLIKRPEREPRPPIPPRRT